jgi:EmrB/QacA subfamily drug resistance transporter
VERKHWTLLAVCTATFMLLIDITIVNVALPDIQSDLDASFSSLQWVIDAYALTLASFLLVAGSVGDRIGRRRVFSFGFALFTVASLACGISGDATVLNFARGVQGAGAAAMFATALALIAQEFEGRERANAIGIWGATVGGSVAIGPLLGGLITEHLGWEWIFFVNVPIGIAAIVLTETKLANVKATDPQPIDWPGLATFSAGLFLLIFGLIRGNPEGWGSSTIVLCLGAAVLLLVAFLVIESRRENAMLDLSLFRKPSFTGVSIVAFALSAGMFAMFLYLTLYIQGVLGYSPLEAGLRFLPLTVLSFVVAPISGRLLNRVPARAIMGTGMILVALGLLLMHGIDVGDDWTTLLAGSVVAGIGIGMTNPGIASVAIGVVSAARAGMASGINSTFRQVGIATGTAALGAIFQSQISSKLSELLPQAPSAFSEAVSSGAAQSALASVPPQFRAQAADAANTAFISGLNEILLVGAAIALVGGIASWALVRGRDMVAVPGAPPPAVPDEARPEPAPAG